MQSDEQPDNSGLEQSPPDATPRRNTELGKRIHSLLEKERFGVLATEAEDQPYTSLVAVAATEDMKRLFLATTRSTRKFANLIENPRVSLLVDSCSHDGVDFENAAALTALGTGREIPENEREEFLEVYLAKHPGLRDFVRSPSCALIEIQVSVYYLARHFQEVMAWRPKP